MFEKRFFTISHYHSYHLKAETSKLRKSTHVTSQFFNVKKLFMHNWHNILLKFGLFEKITLYQQLLSKLASKIDTGKED